MKTKLFYSVFLFLISIMVLGSFIKISLDDYDPEMITGMINGTAKKPYVYRTLVPSAIRVLSILTPKSIENSINEFAIRKTNYFKNHSDEINPTEFLYAIIIWFLSVLGFAFAIRKLLEHFYKTGIIQSYMVSLISVAGLPVFFKYYSYIYDFTHLLLFTICLLLLAKEKWRTFLLVFPFSVLSKETSILLILLFYFDYKNVLPKKNFNKLLIAQISIFIILKVLLFYSFRDNPGSVVEMHLFHNLTLQPYNLSQFFAFLFLLFLVYYDWENKPVFLKNSIWSFLPLLGLALFFGFFDEYRDYYELYPVIILLSYHSIVSIQKKFLKKA